MERESGTRHLVSASISLDNRSGFAPLVKVIWALFLGAGVGLLIRVLSDPVAVLLPLRRRINAAERIIATRDEVGQAPARILVDNARSALGELDAAETARWVSDLEATLAKDPAEAQAGAQVPRPVAQPGDVSGHSEHPTDAAGRRRAVVDVLLDSYWPVGITLILIIVVVGGLQNLYFSNMGFGGDAGDYLQLLAFGAAGQITLATVAEAAGRLAPAKA